MTSFCRFSIKMAYFWKLDSIKTTFEPSYKRKPHWIFSGNSVKLFSILKKTSIWRMTSFLCHFGPKIVKMAHFWGQNDVISKNLGKVVKNFLLQNFGKIIPGGSSWMNLTKKVIKGVRFAKNMRFWLFSLYVLVKIPIHRLIYTNTVY